MTKEEKKEVKETIYKAIIKRIRKYKMVKNAENRGKGGPTRSKGSVGEGIHCGESLKIEKSRGLSRNRKSLPRN